MEKTTEHLEDFSVMFAVLDQLRVSRIQTGHVIDTLIKSYEEKFGFLAEEPDDAPKSVKKARRGAKRQAAGYLMAIKDAVGVLQEINVTQQDALNEFIAWEYEELPSE